MSRGLTTLPDGREVYYDPETGAMAHGMQTVDGREVYLDVHDGHLARSEWVPDVFRQDDLSKKSIWN